MYCLFCVILCIVCVYMCIVLLPPGGYSIAVNKYIISYNAPMGFEPTISVGEQQQTNALERAATEADIIILLL